MSDLRIGVTIVDDAADLAGMMRLRFGMEPDMLCEAFTSVDEAAQRLASADGAGRVRVVLLDWSIPGWRGEDAIRAVAAAAPDARIVTFSGYDASTIGTAAWEAGAWRCVSKHMEFEEVVRVIREVAAARGR